MDRIRELVARNIEVTGADMEACRPECLQMYESLLGEGWISGESLRVEQLISEVFNGSEIGNDRLMKFTLDRLVSQRIDWHRKDCITFYQGLPPEQMIEYDGWGGKRKIESAADIAAKFEEHSVAGDPILEAWIKQHEAQQCQTAPDVTPGGPEAAQP